MSDVTWMRSEIERLLGLHSVEWFAGDIHEIVPKIGPRRIFAVRYTGQFRMHDGRDVEMRNGYGVAWGTTSEYGTLEEHLMRVLLWMTADITVRMREESIAKIPGLLRSGQERSRMPDPLERGDRLQKGRGRSTRW